MNSGQVKQHLSGQRPTGQSQGRPEGLSQGQSQELSFSALCDLVGEAKIDTILVCFVDMQGRLMGKRFHGRHFCDSAFKETHCCDYLLATDLEMYTVPGYRASSWQVGYGDYVMKPDLGTIRPLPWLEGSAMVLCDMLDHHGHPVAHSPRAILKKQIERLEQRGLVAMMATELEFFLFQDSYETLRDRNYRDLVTLGRINQDYNILQTTREEAVMRTIRNGLYGAGIPVENSKGEAETGQEEINIRYAPALETADYHTIAKHAIKEIAAQSGHAATFMPKWHHDKVGSSAHVHQSLWSQDAQPQFYDPQDPLGMSLLMKQFTAGQLKYAGDICLSLAPYINSYKRFKVGTFAPTAPVWSVDNRSSGFRLCGALSQAIRMECRIGGSDINPYIAMAALLAAGLAGIDEELELEPALSGDMYQAGRSRPLPTNLRDAADLADKSDMLRAAWGDEVVDHYVRAARWEVEEHERVVTDFEVARLFEQC